MGRLHREIDTLTQNCKDLSAQVCVRERKSVCVCVIVVV